MLKHTIVRQSVNAFKARLKQDRRQWQQDDIRASIVFDQTLQQPVGHSLCWQVWVDKVHHGQRFIRLQPGVWVTNNSLQAKLFTLQQCVVYNMPMLRSKANFHLVQFPSSAEPELLVAPAEEIDPVAPGSDPINPKLQYLYDKIMEQESRIFKAVWMELCHAAERHLAMIWQLLKLDPTLGARAFLQRNDIVASFAGQALVIWECSPVRPDHVYWDYQSQGRLMFAVPGTKDIVSRSPMVNCNHHSQQFRDLINQLGSLFSQNESDLGRTTPTEHQIDMEDQVSIQKVPYQTPASRYLWPGTVLPRRPWPINHRPGTNNSMIKGVVSHCLTSSVPGHQPDTMRKIEWPDKLTISWPNLPLNFDHHAVAHFQIVPIYTWTPNAPSYVIDLNKSPRGLVPRSLKRPSPTYAIMRSIFGITVETITQPSDAHWKNSRTFCFQPKRKKMEKNFF
uniref:Uncharacterized protein n=1 Tax=Romanomermis culicivorax TaxID=13658 RepID=A0A915J592_ROMCU